MIIEHRYLETVFSSQACLNASFLLDDDAHYGCSSKHHGVDIDIATKLYATIADLENVTIKELVSLIQRNKSNELTFEGHLNDTRGSSTARI